MAAQKGSVSWKGIVHHDRQVYCPHPNPIFLLATAPCETAVPTTDVPSTFHSTTSSIIQADDI